ncbi:DUF1045 domain-containing protein [Rhodobacteraceae bacterium]|nr:DUF1045 domain-containing protein [Paracoccaceae bacterium]
MRTVDVARVRAGRGQVGQWLNGEGDVMEWQRYAIFARPGSDGLVERANQWLGWDPVLGRELAQPMPHRTDIDLAKVTRRPRRYGYHLTLRAPFHLAADARIDDLFALCGQIAAQTAPLALGHLRITRIGSFLAMTPENCADLADLAAKIVRASNNLRADLTPQQYARRKPERLSPDARKMLDTYGYPYVMDQFQPHLTLSGPMGRAEEAAVTVAAEAWFAPHLHVPVPLDAICLMGEDRAQRFHVLERFALRRV